MSTRNQPRPIEGKPELLLDAEPRFLWPSPVSLVAALLVAASLAGCGEDNDCELTASCAPNRPDDAGSDGDSEDPDDDEANEDDDPAPQLDPDRTINLTPDDEPNSGGASNNEPVTDDTDFDDGPNGTTRDGGAEAPDSSTSAGPCEEGARRSCEEGGFLGTCASGVQTCTDEGSWRECSVQPEEADSCALDNDDDCDGVPNGTSECTCIEGETRSCAEDSALGNCALGEQTCDAAGQWGDCSVQPEEADSCTEEDDDADCDGVPNGGCPCVGDAVESCGPEAELGSCQRGTRSCVDGTWSECVGAVFPTERNCNSSADNDCDGEPDNILDDECTCVPASVRPCDSHPGFDGNGPCQAGLQTCFQDDNPSTSSWGECEGAVGPAAQDSCELSGDDADCDGIPNGGCDYEPPSVVAVAPADLATGVSGDAQLVVTFSEPMDTVATEAAFQSSDIGAAAFSWNADNTVLTITPQTPLPYASGPSTQTIVANTFEATITMQAADTSGNMLDNSFSWSFATLRQVTNTLQLRPLGPIDRGGYNVAEDGTVLPCDFDTVPLRPGFFQDENQLAFLVFDISPLPDGIEIHSATLRGQQNGFGTGNPVVELGGPLSAEHIYVPDAQGGLQAWTVPATHELGVFADGQTVTERSLDATEALRQDYENRNSRDNESQYRLLFPNTRTTGADSYWIFVCDTFALDVAYLVP